MVWTPAPDFEGALRDFQVLQKMQPAPAYEFAGPRDETLTMVDFRGKVVLLNFWATWCPPYVKEMPSLNSLQAKLGGDQFEVVALSVDRSRELVEKFMADLNLSALSIYMDTKGEPMKALEAFRIGALPTSIIIGPEDNMVGALGGDADWSSGAAAALISYYLQRLEPVAE